MNLFAINLLWLVCFAAAPLFSNPQTMEILKGNATLNFSPNNCQIRAQAGSILEFTNFTNQEDETLNISLPEATDCVFIRIKSSQTTELQGKITSNGGLYFLNKNGFSIGPNSHILAAELFIKGDTITHSGILQLQNPDGNAGHATLTANQITLKSHSVINASGLSGGGQIYIGGGWQGTDPAIPNAQNVLVAPDAVIHADALDKGNGGTIVVWSEKSTTFLGNITAIGRGPDAQGGLASISSNGFFQFDANVVLNADNSSPGNLLLKNKGL